MRIASVEIQGLLDEQYWVRPKNFDRFFSKDTPGDSAGRRQYAREVLEMGSATKAFRRPVDERTLTRLVAIAEDKVPTTRQNLLEENRAGDGWRPWLRRGFCSALKKDQPQVQRNRMLPLTNTRWPRACRISFGPPCPTRNCCAWRSKKKPQELGVTSQADARRFPFQGFDRQFYRSVA